MDPRDLHNISSMLVLVGLCVMIISIVISLQINKVVTPENKQKWHIITTLMVSFLIGYGSFFFLQFSNIEKYLELLTGLVFLGGAMFVLLVMRLIQGTLKLMNQASRSLEEKVIEYKQVSDKLRHSQANLESLFNTAIPLCITNKNFEIVRANEAYYDVFGRSAQHSDKQKCFESRPGHNCHSDGCPLVRVLQGEKEVVCDTTKKDKAGRKRYFIITGKPFLDANNETIGIVESFQDISKRKRAEDAKEDLIKELHNALDKVNNLRGVSYTRNDQEDTERIHIGVIAQELEEYYPELVITSDDEEGIKSVNYAQITAVLIEAIKELSNKVEKLEKIISK